MLNQKKLDTKILNKMSWKPFESKTGTNPIDISTLDAEEIFIRVGNTNNCVGLTIPFVALPVALEYYRLGGYQSSSNNCLAIIQVKNTEIGLNSYYINGTNYTSSALVSVYYR